MASAGGEILVNEWGRRARWVAEGSSKAFMWCGLYGPYNCGVVDIMTSFIDEETRTENLIDLE